MTRFFVRTLAALAAVPLLAAVPAQAQQFLEGGNTVTGKASATDEPVMYLFVGEVGSTVTFDLTGAGPVGIDLFDREGEKILSAEGEGKARLEAVLPFTEPYMVAVRRGRKSAPYTLTMAADTPDPYLKLFAHNVGYALRAPHHADLALCWVDPGRKARAVFPGGTEEWVLGRDGMRYSVERIAGKEPRFREQRVEINGSTVKVHNLGPVGKGSSYKHEIATERSDDTIGFRAYHCPELR